MVADQIRLKVLSLLALGGAKFIWDQLPLEELPQMPYLAFVPLFGVIGNSTIDLIPRLSPEAHGTHPDLDVSELQQQRGFWTPV